MSGRFVFRAILAAALAAALAACPAAPPQPTEPEARRPNVPPSATPTRAPAGPVSVVVSPGAVPALAPSAPPIAGPAPPAFGDFSGIGARTPAPIATAAGAAPCDQAAEITAIMGGIGKPAGLARDARGRLWVAAYGTHQLVELVPGAGCAWTRGRVIGEGINGYRDGEAATARFNDPRGLAMDPTGRWLYVADYSNHRVRRLDTQADPLVVETYAGSGIGGFRDGPAADAWLYYPAGLAVDAAGALYVADSYNHRIRKVAPGDGGALALTTAAGTGRGKGFGQFDTPQGVAVELPRPPASPTPTPSGRPSIAPPRIFVADTLNHRIVRVEPPSPTPAPGASPAAGGAPTTAPNVSTSLFGPGSDERIYVVIAGNGEAGSADGAGTEARLAQPVALLWDAGTLWVADQENHAVRRIASPLGGASPLPGPSTSTWAGGAPGDADGGRAVARFRYPRALVRGAGADLFVADMDNDRVRRIRLPLASPSPTPSPASP